MQTINDLFRHLETFLPGASLGEDNEGQLIIYTNLKEVGDGYLAEFEVED